MEEGVGGRRGGGGKCGVYVVDSYSVFFIYYIRTHKFSVTLVA
jgi:hypothetical protein